MAGNRLKTKGALLPGRAWRTMHAVATTHEPSTGIGMNFIEFAWVATYDAVGHKAA